MTPSRILVLVATLLLLSTLSETKQSHDKDRSHSETDDNYDQLEPSSEDVGDDRERKYNGRDDDDSSDERPYEDEEEVNDRRAYADDRRSDADGLRSNAGNHRSDTDDHRSDADDRRSDVDNYRSDAEDQRDEDDDNSDHKINDDEKSERREYGHRHYSHHGYIQPRHRVPHHKLRHHHHDNYLEESEERGYERNIVPVERKSMNDGLKRIENITKRKEIRRKHRKRKHKKRKHYNYQTHMMNVKSKYNRDDSLVKLILIFWFIIETLFNGCLHFIRLYYIIYTALHCTAVCPISG